MSTAWRLRSDQDDIGGQVGTAARAIIRGNSLTVVVPAAELPAGTTSYTLTASSGDGTSMPQPVIDIEGVVMRSDAAEAVPGGSEAPDATPAEFFGRLSESIASGDPPFAL